MLRFFQKMSNFLIVSPSLPNVSGGLNGHIFPVPPAMTANLRKAFYSSGAKSDPTDADLLLDLVQQHREKLRRLSPDTEATRLIQNLVEERRRLVDEKTAQSNRLEAHLKIYFPQIPHWFGDVGSPMVCAL